MLKPGMPSHEWLSRQQCECFMCSYKEAVAQLRPRLCCEIIRLLSQVLVGLGTYDVQTVYRRPFLFSR
jgi:hypothetical protein